MLSLDDTIILIKGAGEKATAVAVRLHEYGFRSILMTEIPYPMAERRGVCFSEAVFDGTQSVAGVTARRAEPSLEILREIWAEGEIPVVIDPEARIRSGIRPHILIDGILAKRNHGTDIHDAPRVIALGPGFVAGKDAHAVIETHPLSPLLGDVLTEGRAEEDTGIPESILGMTTERLIKAPASGVFTSAHGIGDIVTKGDVIGHVNESAVSAPVSGAVWGLVRDGVVVQHGRKIGDVDPRGVKALCFAITPRARNIAEGALRAVLGHWNA